MDQETFPHNELLNAFDSTKMRAWLQTVLDNAQQDEADYRQRLAAWDSSSSHSHSLLDEFYAAVQELRECLLRCTTCTRFYSQAYPNLDPDTQLLLQVLQLHHHRLSVIISEQLLGRYGSMLKQMVTNPDDHKRDDTPSREDNAT